MTLSEKVARYHQLLSQRKVVRVLMIASPSPADWFAWEEMAARIEAKVAELELPAYLLSEQRAQEEEV